MNQDIAVLAKRVVVYSELSAAELEARAWEAMLFVGSIYSSATPAGVLEAKADMDARWGAAMAKEGPLAVFRARWHLRTDDGKPPAVAKALVSALDNPARTLSARLAALSAIPEDERAALTDLVRALSADAFAGATGEAKSRYVDVMRELSPSWFSQPWLTILPREHEGPPLQILLDDQGVGANDGSVFDKIEADDPLWVNAVRHWDVDFLRDNPLAIAFQGVSDVADVVVDTGAGVVKGLGDVGRTLATVIKYAPYVLGGLAVASVVTMGAVRLARVGAAS